MARGVATPRLRGLTGPAARETGAALLGSWAGKLVDGRPPPTMTPEGVVATVD